MSYADRDFTPRIMQKWINTRADCDHRGPRYQCYHMWGKNTPGECPRGEGFPKTCPLRKA